jgi:hypothetical protein
MVPGKGKNALTRSGLRDVIILLSVVSAFFYQVSSVRIGVALCLLVLGSFIHFVSKGVLIRNEVLCKDGIYSIVRHPYYLANYLIDTGFCVLSGNLYLLLAYIFLFFWSYGPTLREEEERLTEKHGDDSLAFMLRTPPVFPDRRSVSHLPSLFAGFSATRISSKELARIVRFYAVACLIIGVGRIGAASRPSIRLLLEPAVAFWLLSAILLCGVSLVALKWKKKVREPALFCAAQEPVRVGVHALRGNNGGRRSEKEERARL